VLGGAGTYAAAGARLFTNGVGLVSGVGEDLFAGEIAWFRRNGIDEHGLDCRGPHTPRSTIVYFADGEREETPQFGPEHFASMRPSPRHMPVDYRGAAAFYVFADTDPSIFAELAEVGPGRPLILWELAANAATPATCPVIAERLATVEIVSLNRTEAEGLFGPGEPECHAQSLLEAGVAVVVLRLGAGGALVATRLAAVHVAPASAHVVDPTGAGNAFGGAFLAAYAMTRDPVWSGQCGAAAAALMLQQFGPPPLLDSAAALRLARSVEVRRVPPATGPNRPADATNAGSRR
jgi:sugar/nucleoside kinase (ribokinase family)